LRPGRGCMLTAGDAAEQDVKDKIKAYMETP